MTDTTPFVTPPTHVASGELIESAWGNAVVDTLGAQSVRITSAGGSPGATQGMQIEQNTAIVTTDASGQAAVNYVVPFPSIAYPVISNGDVGPGDRLIFTVMPGISSGVGFWFRAKDAAGAVLANTTVRINYCAVGPR